MNWFALLLLSLGSISVDASVTLTLCPAANNLTVPCLNETATGRIVSLPALSNQSYNFSNLNITTVQDLPSNATWVDLSFNQISNISRRIPSTVSFLNLSHNRLQSNWIQTSLPMRTLDVSYNQGGLTWFKDILWGVSLANLTRLVFRGNNVTNLTLNYDNVPDGRHPFRNLDLIDNPQLSLRTTMSVYLQMSHYMIVTADPNSYNNTLRDCENRSDYVVSLDSYPVYYSPQGDAEYNKSVVKPFFLCSWGYVELVRTSQSPGARDGQSPTVYYLAIGVALFFLVLIFLARRMRTREREEAELRLRTTPSSSTCTNHDIAGLEIYQAMPICPDTDNPVYQAMPVSNATSTSEVPAIPVGGVGGNDVFEAMPVGDVSTNQVLEAIPVGQLVSDRLHEAMPVSSQTN
ncbi:hypothetical protein LEN26_017579 [Aphanomyces euteiches]|nr:hypothetical protein LEN26_017579 [Aphanomyces euteiches]